MPDKQISKWEFWDITDEQAERINSGDIDEYNSFFMRNYDVIRRMAQNKLKELATFYHSEKDEHDIINAFYYDMSLNKFIDSKDLCRHFRKSALAVDRSCNKLANHLSPNTLRLSYKSSPIFTRIECESPEDGEIFYLCDLFEASPTPQEELDEETHRQTVLSLSVALSPIVGARLCKYLPFMLNGISNYFACEHLGQKKNCSYRYLIEKLVINYDKVLEIMQDLNCDIPPYLLNEEPPRYSELIAPILAREEKRLQGIERNRKRANEYSKRRFANMTAEERAERNAKRRQRYNEQKLKKTGTRAQDSAELPTG